MTRIATLGAAFSANKGAASMLQAVVDNLPGRVGPCSFDVLTTHPHGDRRVSQGTNVRIVSATPLQLAFIMFPLAVLSAFASLLRVPRRVFCITPALRALETADLVVDIAGISFVDSRGVANLAYNALMTSVPLLLGKKVVKVAQALGPFRSPLNRFVAKLILPRVHTICARGAATEEHLADLQLRNVVRADDLAFSMRIGKEAEEKAGALLPDAGAIGVVPSAVVEAQCRKRGLDYVGELARFVHGVLASGDHRVVVFPHSGSPDAKPGRMNDVPLCRELYERVEQAEGCRLIDQSLSPQELRALIARCEVVVTSRFHAMISALATSTPVVVVGWSHKYGEVLDEFGLADYGLGYESISAEALLEVVESAVSRRSALTAQIQPVLVSVVKRSALNFDCLARALDKSA